MKIAVCLKLTPVTTADIRVAADGRSLLLADVETALSFYDEHALEAALRLRDALAGTTIHALSVGGDECVKCLQHAAALGAASVLHIAAPGVDARAAARLAAAALRDLAPDLAFCGRQAIDDDLRLFPGALGELLGWPHLSAATSLEVAATLSSATARRRCEGGEEALQAALPAVVSWDRTPFEPRIPTLKAKLAARRRQPDVRTPDSLGVSADELAAALAVTNYAPPPQRAPGRIITGPPEEAAAELARLLRGEAGVI